jgi:fumarylacetoacetate (FAA) hydrolase family protein
LDGRVEAGQGFAPLTGDRVTVAANGLGGLTNKVAVADETLE